MIPVLYGPNEENFTTNGVGLLVDAISCVVTEERNGAFELVLKYPAKSLLSKYISEDCIIKARPNDTDEAQLFRIYGRSKPVKGTITWKAEHISYELNGYPVERPKITGKNAAEAIGQLLEDAVVENNYIAWSDITTRNNTEIDEVLSVRKALGGVEGSVLDVWGGEYRFNNYRVELWKARGKDNGVQIRYGKNMLDGQQEKNISNVITAVFPYCYYTPEKAEGATETPEPIFVSLPEKIIKTPNADKYARTKCEPVDFSNKFEDGVVITEAMLRKVAAEYAVSGIDEPEVSIKTTFAALHQTKEYANIKELEKVGICDIVTVIFEDLDTAVKAKIVKYSYDVLKERFDSTEIGSVRSNLTKEISKQQSENEKIIIKTATRAEKIQKDIEKTILNVTAAITGNSGGHVVLYPPENPQEIFIMDTDDTATAKNVWRWNLAGLGHSSNGIGGPFTTAITADGQIVADFITAGKLTGLILEAGTVKAEALDVLYKQSVIEYVDTAAGMAIKAAEEYADAIEDDLKKEVSDIENKVGELDTEIKTTVADGIITTAEKASINKIILSLQKEKAEADAQYTQVYNNSNLKGEAKTTLHNSYNSIFGNSSSSKYNILISKVNSVLNATTKTAIETAVVAYNTAHNNYKDAAAAYQTALEAATDNIATNYATNAEGEAKKYADEIQKSIKKEVTDVDTKVEDLNTEIKTTVADGIITTAEKASINKMLLSIQKEKAEADAQYTQVYNNSNLKGEAKTTLHNSYNSIFENSSSSKYNILISKVNSVLNATTKTAIETAVAAYNTAHNNYKDAAAAYQTALEAATDNIATNYATNAEASAIKEAETRISAVKGEIELEVKEVDMANRHDYITNGDGSKGSEGWYFNNTSYITTTTYLGSSCFKITKPTSTSSYVRFYVPNSKAGKWILRYKVATEAAYAATARVQSSFYSSQTTPIGAIKATEWTTVEREITIPSDGSRYLYIYNSVQNTNVYITDVELLGSYKDYADAKFTVHSDEITAEVERATSAEDTLKAGIKVNADAIKLKVTSGDVESLIEQKASSIRLKATTISWSATYSSMTAAGTLTCQNANIKGTLKSENGNNIVEMRSGRFRITYNGQELGLIGGNGFAGYTDKEGLNFDLESTGDYMTWAAQPSANANYDCKWTYARSSFSNFTGGALNAGCDIDMKNWSIKNVSWPGGGITGTCNFVQIKAMSSDGTASTWVNGAKMQFKNGILISGTWN